MLKTSSNNSCNYSSLITVLLNIYVNLEVCIPSTARFQTSSSIPVLLHITELTCNAVRVKYFVLIIVGPR